MNYSKIAVRYARALFMSAVEKNLLDEVHADVQLLDDTLTKNTELKDVLRNPVIKPSRKKSVFEAVFSAHIQPLSMIFFNLVITNNREEFICGICRNFGDQYRKEKNIMRAKLTTAGTVKEETINEIKSMLAKSYNAKIQITTNVNKSIVGGFILTVDEKQFDASVANALRKIRKELTTDMYKSKL